MKHNNTKETLSKIVRAVGASFFCCGLLVAHNSDNLTDNNLLAKFACLLGGTAAYLAHRECRKQKLNKLVDAMYLRTEQAIAAYLGIKQ